MKFLIHALSGLDSFVSLRQAVREGKLPAAVTGLSGIHKAAFAYAMYSDVQEKQPMLFLAADDAEALRLTADLCAMGVSALSYPARDFTFRETEGVSREYERQRIRVLCHAMQGACDVVVACIDAALQYTIPPADLKQCLATLSPGTSVSLQTLTETLVQCGYERADQTEGPGQFSQRGGILDFFTPDASLPVRAEFWGDEIDTLSFFDPQTQRRTDPVQSVTLAPSVEALVFDPSRLAQRVEQHASSLRGKAAPKAKEHLNAMAQKLRQTGRLSCADPFFPFLYRAPACLFDYFLPGSLLFVSETAKQKDRVRTAQWQWAQDCKDYLEEGLLCRGLDCFQFDWTYALTQFENRRTIYLDSFVRGSYETPVPTLLNVTARQLSPWGGSISLLVDDLHAMLAAKHAVTVLAGNEKSAQSLTDDLLAQNIPVRFSPTPDAPTPECVTVTVGTLSAGMEFPTIQYSLMTHGQFHSGGTRRKAKKRNPNTQELYSLSELTPGDYVVHATHGIGVFEGIHKIDMQGIIKDYIKVRYAKKDTLYVPVTQLDLVAKYIGPREDSLVKLSRLGGAEWQKAKARVRTAVKDMAKELIKLYAQRMQAKGFAFGEDGEWQRDFESHFPFEETDDQLRCIEEIKADMQAGTPMDRLLCGDVGFGKTEVALRAAFKCVTNSKQCALLVPTTILAWQHYQTICKRMEGFPVTIELLSRFRTPKQQEQILKRLERGEVDLIVGTHRLVSKDVKFCDLGLVIIDEEQRFGVAQKEKLKNLCKNVDVLTLSATPIPRTLNMALSGIRDMSVIEQAPHDRHPVQTYVLEYDPPVILDAIRRELRRGGQTYYLHNNVENMERFAAFIQTQIPEARVGIGHGKMPEAELSEVWRKLIEHEIDVLVCTTIIETGVDVPNVNTLIIDGADRMGLSQLHQIRGRVGRSSRRGYAYLTFTRDKILSEIAQKRLSAIREFTEFGSGFKIAMRDLEIRGAGNILGGEQHGHMESVGYDMYLKLLGEAVRIEKGEPAPPQSTECLVDVQVQAHIPERYISSLAQRLEIYRRIADIRSPDDVSDVIDELIDRFGDPPASVKGLIDVALLRNTAASLGIVEVKQKGNTMLLYPEQVDMKQVGALTAAMRGRVLLSAGAKPYLSVKFQSDLAPLDVLSEIMSVLKHVTKEE